jgi:hypothetical protein
MRLRETATQFASAERVTGSRSAIDERLLRLFFSTALPWPSRVEAPEDGKGASFDEDAAPRGIGFSRLIGDRPGGIQDGCPTLTPLRVREDEANTPVMGVEE